jgi:hypothetical protein
MPIKYNLTKFDKISEHIQEVASREVQNNPDYNPPTEEEMLIKTEAVILTVLCSSFSYQTSKSIMNGATDIDSDSIKEEHRLAREGRWRQLRNPDIQEVASMNIKDSNFYQWLHYNVNKEEQELYKRAWNDLKTKFNGACDEVGAESVRY